MRALCRRHRASLAVALDPSPRCPAGAPVQYHTNSHESDAWRPIRDLRKLDANVSG